MDVGQYLMYTSIGVLTVLAGLRIGWNLWGKHARMYRAYRLAHDSLLDKLQMLADGKITDPASVQRLAQLGIESSDRIIDEATEEQSMYEDPYVH